MTVLFFVLLLLAGVCFGLAAGRVTTRRLASGEFLALGLLLWVAVDAIKTLQHLA
jgi:hypothetical protein